MKLEKNEVMRERCVFEGGEKEIKLPGLVEGHAIDDRYLGAECLREPLQNKR